MSARSRSLHPNGRAKAFCLWDLMSAMIDADSAAGWGLRQICRKSNRRADFITGAGDFPRFF